jgi:hypothetical protein
MQHTTKDNRLHVWLLISNITLAPQQQPDCWQQRSVNYTTQLYSQEANFSSADAHRLAHELLLPSSPAPTGTSPSAGHRDLLAAQEPAASPTAAADPPAASTASPAAPAAPLAPRRVLHSLGFSYIRDAFVLPATASDQFLQMQNVTLLQLPQGPNAHAAADVQAAPWPPDVWTVLLWSVNR